MSVSITPDLQRFNDLKGLHFFVDAPMAGHNGAGFQLAAGTLDATLVAEVSYDGGNTWNIVNMTDPTAGTTSQTLVVTNPNPDTARYITPLNGASDVRVRVSLFTSGDAICTLNISLAG